MTARVRAYNMSKKNALFINYEREWYFREIGYSWESYGHHFQELEILATKFGCGNENKEYTNHSRIKSSF